MAVKLKRAYEPPSPEDGERYLVERLWPRGASKQSLALNGWLKDLAPSTELRKWYRHEPERWMEFASRYRLELDTDDNRRLLAELAKTSGAGGLTLVFATRDAEHSGARVLAEVIECLASQPG